METPSQPTLSRIALGALDVNKHLNSPLGSPKKSPVKKHNFVFTDDGAEQAPVARSMKERLLETEVPVLRETPVRVVEAQVSPRSEKRKEAPTDVGGREEERVKVARIEGREMGGLGLASELGGVDAVGMEGDEGLESTQATSVCARTPSASPEVPLGTSHSTTLTSPDTVPNSARESPTPTAQANTTDSELRQNASALRLRLKFAMYKLKTNQHDIPLSRLELLSPLPKRTSPARPTTAISSPPHGDESEEEPGSATPKPKHRQLMDLDVEGLSLEKVEMLTPLPRHMQVGVGAMPGGYEELTSSGVKGRAADGLLSLMGVRE
ncbi:hypothetical protein VC83_05200 [Pseudogymnoascus destructans]|uniref:Uncharacterized protein n=1 Tax=Pseudogymnoascus destructans TaxID=655981 RepID=A0A177A9Q1_9PEZI|nr:uncharacterized protein VC83_05200 [Pseudogymnoascus destructans]OAF57913.1 hypothetical protein VC83_05200 [Pseudogymnoascus destructans]